MINSPILEIVPTKFMLLSSGTYQPQNLRTWEIGGNVRSVNNLANHIAATASTSVTADLIAKAAPEMMSVGLQHQGVIPIASGWGMQRAVFVLAFTVKYQVGASVDYLIQGYTDNPSFGTAGMDDNMVFYINTVLALNSRSATVNGITGMRTSLMADFQVVNGFGGGTMGQPTGNLLIRPIDVFSSISTAELSGMAKVTDATQLANVGVQTSRHSNNISNMMLADTMNTWHAASLEVDTVGSVGMIADMAYARQMETTVEQDTFLSLLARHTNGGGVSSFMGRTLMKAIPNIMKVYHPITSSGSDVRWSNAGDGGIPGAGNMETIAALNIQATLPSLMVESMLGTLSFSVTNANNLDSMNIANYDGQRGAPVWTRHGISCFATGQEEHWWAVFKQRFMRDLYPFLNKGRSFMLVVSCSFYHEINIQLKMDNEVHFISPAFCNALYSPVQTTSALKAQEFAKSFETMITDVNEALMESEMRRANAGNKQVDTIARASASNAFPAPPMPVQLNMTPAPSMTASLYGSSPSQPVVGSGMGGSMLGARPAAPATSAPAVSGGSMLSGLKR